MQRSSYGKSILPTVLIHKEKLLCTENQYYFHIEKRRDFFDLSKSFGIGQMTPNNQHEIGSDLFTVATGGTTFVVTVVLYEEGFNAKILLWTRDR